MPWFIHEADAIGDETLAALLARLVEEARRRLAPDPRRVLLLPPDLTRLHSGAGHAAELLYRQLAAAGADVHLIPTLGQHRPHAAAENRRMFGAVPLDRIHVHDWRGGVRRLGTVPAATVAELTAGRADWEIPVQINRAVMDEPWDWIVHIGHVVPHEVLGFASHNKNYFVGLGGPEAISAAHLAAAACGIENNLGCLVAPVRACFDWAEERYLGGLRDVYCLLVLAPAADAAGALALRGVYVGDDRETYLAAARASARLNITRLAAPAARVVAYMQPDEFRSTWVANKAIYRTRLALAAGGELLVIAPGVERFGEQPDVDALIRRHGYRGTPATLAALRADPELRALGLAAAHLMNGSSEGRFAVGYAPGGLRRAEIEGVGYDWLEPESALARYQPAARATGWHDFGGGERAYFVASPSLGLWTAPPAASSANP